MLCKTAHPGSTYNDLRLQDKCNVIVIMRGDYAGDYKPNYVLDGTSIAAPDVITNYYYTNPDDYSLRDDPCETRYNVSNSKYDDINSTINHRPKIWGQTNMAESFHVSSAVFHPHGNKVIWPNFVDNSLASMYSNLFSSISTPKVKFTAKTSLRHWTKERVFK